MPVLFFVPVWEGEIGAENWDNGTNRCRKG